MKIIKGVKVPIVTPIHSDYSIDEGAVEKVVTLLVSNDSVPFVLGTTGEAASLSFHQKLAFVKKRW